MRERFVRVLVGLACVLALVAGVLGAPREAAAHDFKPGVLALIERSPGRFEIVWTAPVDTRTAEREIHVAYPPACKVDGASLACGTAGLDGAIVFDGLEGHAQAVVTVAWSDGRAFDAVVTSGAPRVEIRGGSSASAVRWVRLGIVHVLTGLDHVAFVVGLLLVVGAHRRLVATVTAFTIAHSITLALAATHVLQLSSAPVEATIAASVVLVAVEATRGRPTVTRVYPWAVAGLFGLVHGLGFASALSEIGLPRSSSALALVSFNVGVELAQLAIVATFLVAARFVRLSPRHAQLAKTIACYALGSLGSYWLVSRTFAIFTSS